MRVLITGGCKNGKSFLAQRIAKAQGTPLYYVATMISTGREDDERIRRHIRERDGWGFATLEIGENIGRLPRLGDPNGSFLLDSATALLSNEMFSMDGHTDLQAGKKVERELCEVVRALPNLVVVSDYIYSDAIMYDDMTNAYRKALGSIECMLARECETVLEVCFGSTIVHKGKMPFLTDDIG